jgi:hypothetical protein
MGAKSAGGETHFAKKLAGCLRAMITEPISHEFDL